jgi:hypothetical protein
MLLQCLAYRLQLVFGREESFLLSWTRRGRNTLLACRFSASIDGRFSFQGFGFGCLTVATDGDGDGDSDGEEVIFFIDFRRWRGGR